MITHKFREVMAFADEVTILRRGRHAGSGRVADLTPDAMAGMMIGAQELTKAPPRSGQFGATRLELDRVSALDDAGQPALHAVSLAVKGGEIVGIAGVSGNGQRQLVEVLAGQRDASGGEVRIAGEPYHATRDEMRRHKLSCLPEEAAQERLRLAHERFGEYGVSRFRPRSVRRRRLVAAAREVARAGANA